MASKFNIIEKNGSLDGKNVSNYTFVLSDTGDNCIRFQRPDGSTGKMTISNDKAVTGRRLHYNTTFLVIGIRDDYGRTGGYSIRWLSDLSRGFFVDMKMGVVAIHITADNKVALGGFTGELHLLQLDGNGKEKKLWIKKLHSDRIADIEIQQDRIFTASVDKKCGIFSLSDGTVLQMFSYPSVLWSLGIMTYGGVVTGGNDGNLYLHQFSTGETSIFARVGSLPVYALKMSSDKRTIYCNGGDKLLFAVDVSSRSTRWQLRCQNDVSSIWEQDGLVVAALKESNAICVDGASGIVKQSLGIAPTAFSWGVVMVPEPSPSPTISVDPHKQCRDELAAFKSSQAQQTQLDNAQIKDLRQALDFASQQFQNAQLQIKQLDQQLQTSQHNAQQQITLLNQQILALKAENDKFKAEQSRLQVNAFVSKINTLSGPEVVQFASFLNINVTGIDSAKLDASSMLAHGSFDEFFEAIDVDPELHDCLLRLYSVVKKTQETGQLPVEHAIAPWIAKQDQDGKIAGRFAELQYTEEMMTYLDAKLVAHRTGIKASLIKKLQADFIASQCTAAWLLPHNPDSNSSADATSRGPTVLLSFD